MLPQGEIKTHLGVFGDAIIILARRFHPLTSEIHPGLSFSG